VRCSDHQSGGRHPPRSRSGSEAHKVLFCRQFIESYIEFDPATLPWPELEPAALERLRGVPFWREVRHTERRAGAIVAAFTETITDPLAHASMFLDGFASARSKLPLTVWCSAALPKP
jgi:hypothetical protein